MYCVMSKGTSRAEVMSNCEKIKPVALAVIELVSQLVSQLLKSVSQSLENSVKYF